MTLSHRRSCISLILLALALLVPSTEVAVAGTGTDITYGYTWIDSDEPGGPIYTTYTWTNMCGPAPCPEATEFPGNLPWQGQVTLPFAFPFYGTSYNTVEVFDNGFLTFFAQNDYEDTNKPIPLPRQSPDTVIALLWDDLRVQRIEYGEAQTTPQSYRFRWQGDLCQDAGCNNTEYFRAEALLFSDGTIRFQYEFIVDNGSTTVGIEDQTGDDGIQNYYNGTPAVAPPGRTDLLVNNYVIEYTPPKPPDCADAIPITCGQTIPSSTPPNPSGYPADGYNCGGGSMLANERVFEIVLTETSWLRANVSAATDLRAFLLTTCDSSRCSVGNSATLDVPMIQAGRYYLTVDGPTAASNGNFDLTVECDSITQPVSCGDTDVPGDTSSGVAVLNNYGCRTGDYSGRERYYGVTLPAGGNLVATVDGPPNLDVFLFDANDLDPASCIGDGDVSAGAYGLPAGDYVIVVDGPAGSDAPFTLDVTCGTNFDCSNLEPETLTCGSAVSGSTIGGPTNVRRYNCDERDFPGPEVAYRLNLTMPAELIITLNSDEPLGLFILQGCDEGACLGGDDLAACTDILPAGNYFLVVDSQLPGGADFDLEVRCGLGQQFDDWRDCEYPSTAYGGDTTIDDTVKRRWGFNDDWFCPGSLTDVPGCKGIHNGCSTHRNTDLSGRYNGCQFAMYAVVECGTEFHLPQFDVESGRIRIYDMLRQEYVYIYGETPTWSAEGTEVCWIDSGCVDGDPCTAGSDGRYDAVMNDIHFFGPTPGEPVCGIFRLEFYEWGGYEWELYANCNGSRAEGFLIYDNVCDAVRAYNPRPELSIVDPVVTGSCPNYTVDFELHNTGCADAQAFHVEVWEDRPDPDADILHHEVFVSELAGGDFRSYSLPMNLQDSASLNIVISADAADEVEECSEASDTGSAVACFPQRGEHTYVTPICTDCLVDPVGAAVPPSICAPGDSLLTAAGSTVATCANAIEYAWTTDPVPPGPADPAWGTGNRDLPRNGLTASETWYLRVRCSDDINCYNSDPYPVTITVEDRPDISAAQAVDEDVCATGVLLSWIDATGGSAPIVYNIYRADFSGNIAADCAVATSSPPIITGFTGTSYLDITTSGNGEYVYVIQAEDSAVPPACLPAGPDHGGAVFDYCIAAVTGVPVLDEVDGTPFVPDVGDSLRGVDKTQNSAWFLWSDVRPPGSTRDYYRVFRSTRSTGPFEMITPPLDVPDYDDADAPAILYYYDVRVVDTCGNVSEDPFPGTPPPQGCPSLELLCGRTLDADTVACEDMFSEHACFARDAGGPDRMHSIRIQQPGNVTFRLVSSDMDQDLYVYDASLETCLDWGDGEVTLFDPAPGRYFVVVDGAAGQQGGYRLEVSCP